ncbi:MAG: putative aminohydrolase SsnA [Caldithrix sp.]|nr:putative aminohydrolase SsnA [Caldithrix sp.]
MSQTILIKDVTVITLGSSNRVLHKAAVLIEDNRIKKVTTDRSDKLQANKIIDGSGKVMMPGFINAHMHFYSTFVRGLTKAQPARHFEQVLHNLWWRLDKQLTGDDIYYSALLMLLTAIRKGTTTFIDHHASPNCVRGSLQKIADAVEQSGLRAALCYEVSDRDGPEATRDGLEENREFIEYCRQEHTEHLKALFGLHASFTISDATLEKAADIGQSLNSGFHLHAAEAEADQRISREKFGLSVVERLHQFGILGHKSLAIHGVHIDEQEMEFLKDTETAVVHNPQSNLNNGVGIADITTMMNKGILVGLGTDAMTVNMFDELRTALWAQHLRYGDPSVGFLEAVNSLFINNARIANRYWPTPLGVIEEGATADIILLDYDPPTPLIDDNIWGHLVFGMFLQPVDTTIANGRILMENKQLKLDIDEQEVVAKSRELSAKLWERF